ncbi:MAG: hypothetical protein Q8922_02120 [Bacteroidota bacterium]|nr:hypothetical protein [Bacteroidota bacterium]MDP4232330.1 hypothetical protein [Bacteroidota bacterium]MDP4241469.1 hypothetical protein [Bacteroidota bacterium]MDP4286707.1 hypothetical protein [Bacteroidota bacterium]
MFSARRLACLSVFLFVGCSGLAFAQPVSRTVMASYALNSVQRVPRPVTVPMFVAAKAYDGSHKSPFLAAGLSFLIPGLGEYYCGEQIWRGLIFTGLEVGLWVEYAHFINEFNDSTTAFRSYSDAHWSKGRYASSLDTQLVLYQLKPIADSTDCASINRAEAQLDSLGNLSVNPVSSLNDMGHRLACSDIQQYYEMISKYRQYLPGWDAVSSWNEAAAKSGRMNDTYGLAQTMVWGVIINHVLSAVDAALLASDHNSKLRLHGDLLLKSNPNGSLGYVPTANVSLTF